MAKDDKAAETPPAPPASQATTVQTVAVTTAKPQTWVEKLEASRADSRSAKAKYREAAAKAAGKYSVTALGLTSTFEARDANDAWAQFCDAHKTWPSPKYTERQIVKVE